MGIFYFIVTPLGLSFQLLQDVLLPCCTETSNKTYDTLALVSLYHLYRPINCIKDHHTHQHDLQQLEIWAKKWGMRFNAKKCYIMSINNKSSHFYELDKHILQQVPENPYLGITISEDFKWTSHINKISWKANSTLGFLRRNLKHCPESC